jgi:hypothetical protein
VGVGKVTSCCLENKLEVAWQLWRRYKSDRGKTSKEGEDIQRQQRSFLGGVCIDS